MVVAIHGRSCWLERDAAVWPPGPAYEWRRWRILNRAGQIVAVIDTPLGSHPSTEGTLSRAEDLAIAEAFRIVRDFPEHFPLVS
jgi:hypothetical protein